jgi:hypothetical protein
VDPSPHQIAEKGENPVVVSSSAVAQTAWPMPVHKTFAAPLASSNGGGGRRRRDCNITTALDDGLAAL